MGGGQQEWSWVYSRKYQLKEVLVACGHQEEERGGRNKCRGPGVGVGLDCLTLQGGHSDDSPRMKGRAEGGEGKRGPGPEHVDSGGHSGDSGSCSK